MESQVSKGFRIHSHKLKYTIDTEMQIKSMKLNLHAKKGKKRLILAFTSQ